MSDKKYTVNIHFLRCCNYQCKFCFHRGIEDESSLPVEKWLQIIDNIARSKYVKRINFAGGEPFLIPKLFKTLLNYAKQKGIETSVITNASLFKTEIFYEVKDNLDMIGISVDSGDDEINLQIGRHPRTVTKSTVMHTAHVRRVAQLAKENHKFLKLNTVICRENLNDMSIFSLVNEIKPDRWKVFRVLKIENENGVSKDEREPYTGFLTDEEWDLWRRRCEQYCKVLPVYENNSDMMTSYILVDEEGYILDSSSGSKVRRYNLLETELDDVFNDIGFNQQKFIERHGYFDIKTENKSTDIEDLTVSS